LQQNDLQNEIKEVSEHPVFKVDARDCVNEPVYCIPVIMERVCASGSESQRHVHFLSETKEGKAIPQDACPLNCVVCNFAILGIGDEPCPEGVLSPRRLGDNVVFTISYQVRVWFEYFDTAKQCLEVGVAGKRFIQEISVPIQEIEGGWTLCPPEEIELCIRRIKLNCLCAHLVPRKGAGGSTTYVFKVIVQTEFFVMESGRSVICMPSCSGCMSIPAVPDNCQSFEQKSECPTCADLVE